MDQEFSLEQQNMNSGLSCGYPIGSVNNSYNYPSSLIQSLFDPELQPEPQPQPQNSLFTNPSMSSSYSSSSNELSPTWTSLMKHSMPKQQLSGLLFSNNTPFWNASADALNDIRAGVFVSSQPQHQSPNFEDNKFNSPNTLLNKVYNYLFIICLLLTISNY